MQITSGRLQKPIKCVLYGPEGIGKSTFAAMAPFPLFCDVEDSTAHMDVRRLPKATSYQMVLDEINYVKANPHLCDTFVMDTADWAERLCRENVCAKNGKTGIEDFGYGKAFIRTIPLLQYDEHKPEDLDTDGEDHVADEVRYFLMSRPIKPRTAVKPEEYDTDPRKLFLDIPKEDILPAARKPRMEVIRDGAVSEK